MSEPQRKRETTPEDEGIPDHDDEEMPLPGDRPLASQDRVTAREQQERETVRQRVARERPEDASDAQDGAERPRPNDRRTPGRFYEETVDGDDVTREVEATETEDREALSAEEEAVREEPG